MKPTESIPTALLVAVLACAVIAAPATAAQFDNQSEDAIEIVVEEQTSETVTVLLNSSANDVAGLEANLTYDADVVQLASMEGVDLAEPISRENNENGWVFISQAQANGVDNPTMLRLTFDVVSEGTTELSFVAEETDLFNSDGQKIPVLTTSAAVDLSADDPDSDDANSDDGTAESDADGGTDDGSTADGTTSGDEDNADDDEMSADDSGSDGSDSDDDESAGDGSDDANSDDTADEASVGGGSSMVSGIGLMAVVGGFLFAVALLARDQL